MTRHALLAAAAALAIVSGCGSPASHRSQSDLFELVGSAVDPSDPAAEMLLFALTDAGRDAPTDTVREQFRQQCRHTRATARPEVEFTFLTLFWSRDRATMPVGPYLDGYDDYEYVVAEYCYAPDHDASEMRWRGGTETETEAID